MATIGQLAASLAHEIKNPLAGISGAVQILSTEIEDSHPHSQIMKEILQQIDRLDSAVEDLLIYARPKPPELRQTDVGQVIRSCLNVLRGDPSLQALTLNCEGADHHLDAMIDPVQMEQVVSNLILNAAQACKSAGQITIALTATDDQLMICVQDNGEGMSDQTRKRALEPFFTTKARGTGLGLSICAHIVQAHHGSLKITSTQGVGTRVEICLPRRPAATGETRSVT
jgi:signal transduction histidine kinase